MPLDVEMLLGKPGEGEKGQGFAYVASSELDPLLGCPNFTNGWVFFFYKVEYKNIQATEECGC